MDSVLITELGGRAPTLVILVTITLPDHTIRWTNGGMVTWDGNAYAARDATYGLLDSVSPISDGVGSQATTCTVTMIPPSMAAIEALGLDPEVQGSVVTVHLGAVDQASGELVGEPELIFRGEFDQPSIATGSELKLNLECITEEARMLEPHDERRLTDSFHQSVWSGELFYENVTAVRRVIYWRADVPSGVIG